MKTTQDKSDELLRGWLSGSMIEKAPVDFTTHIMQKIEASETVPQNSFVAWFKEYFYYMLAIVFIGAMGFYFSGPYNVPGSKGVATFTQVLGSWIQYLQEGLLNWNTHLQWSSVAAVIFFSLVIFALLDHLIKQSLKTQY